MITIPEDREFLLAQREKGRRGSMVGVDAKLAAKEKRSAERQEQMLARKRRMEDLKRSGKEIAELISSSSSTDTEEEDASCIGDRVTSEGAVGGSLSETSSKRKRGRTSIITPELAAALDRTKLSDRKATFVIAETVKSLGLGIDDIALNRDTIRRERIKQRSEQATALQDKFKTTCNVPLVVHWDGKLIADLTSKEKIDRLPVIVSGNGVYSLLTVAKLARGTGEDQAAAVYMALEEWGIADRVRAMSFDTTSSNTGRIAGACVLLEQKLGKELLSLACRHHVMELIIGAVFQVCLGSTSSPEVPLFKRFQGHWQFIDQQQYETGLTNNTVSRSLQDIKDGVVEFANSYLEKSQPRDDYREFTELVIIFLGSIPQRGVRFMAPGAMHHARWLSKVIYSLKVWMFRGQFHLTQKEEKGLQDVCVFAARVYLQAWISAPLAASAPYNDLHLLKSLLEYSAINTTISKAASLKFSKHLWYLSPELVALAFFDNHVSSATKRLMITAMQNDEDTEQGHTKRISVDLDTFIEKNLEDFISAKSRTLFELMELPDTFLTVDPDLWKDREDYQKAAESVHAIKVVNDHAERGVALIQEFSGLMTHDELQLQYLLQVVQEHRQAYPDTKKETLSASTKIN